MSLPQAERYTVFVALLESRARTLSGCESCLQGLKQQESGLAFAEDCTREDGARMS